MLRISRRQSAHSQHAFFVLARMLRSKLTRILAGVRYPNVRKSAYSLALAPSPNSNERTSCSNMTQASPIADEVADRSSNDTLDDAPSLRRSRSGSVVGRAAEERAAIKRRAHRKSRYGCKNCKTRRIKVEVPLGLRIHANG